MPTVPAAPRTGARQATPTLRRKPCAPAAVQTSPAVPGAGVGATAAEPYVSPAGPFLAGPFLPFQLFSLVYVMDRWQSGLGAGRSVNPLRGSWHPVTGPALPLMMTARLIVFGLFTWRATYPPAALPAGDGAARFRAKNSGSSMMPI